MSPLDGEFDLLWIGRVGNFSDLMWLEVAVSDAVWIELRFFLFSITFG